MRIHCLESGFVNITGNASKKLLDNLYIDQFQITTATAIASLVSSQRSQLCHHN